VALVTPFTKDGKNVDYEALKSLIDFQITNGTDGIVVVGTTGETPTLSSEEYEEVVRVAVKHVNKRVKLVVGTGSNSTQKTIENTKFAKTSGADAALVVVPYYNKPTQEGLFLHYQAVEEVRLPIILYNVPSRTGCSLAPSTVARLAVIPNVVAIKEAGGSVDTVSEILSTCSLCVLSGDESLTLPFMSVGARGVVSVVANIAPKLLKDLVSAAEEGDYVKAREIHLGLFNLSRTLFVESNPIPVKTALGLLGLCNDTVRLPLCPISDAHKAIVRQSLVELNLL